MQYYSTLHTSTNIRWLAPLGSALLLSNVDNPPDGVRAIIGDQQGTVRRHGYANWSAPNVPILNDKSGHKILVRAAGAAALVHGDADHLVARAHGAVPRAMLGGENVAFVFNGKRGTLVHGHFKRCIVWLKEHVGNKHLVFQFRMLPGVSWILVRTDVPPRPAIETALFDVCDVVRHQVIPQAVSFIHRAPQLEGDGMDHQPSARIADPISVHAH